MPLFLFFHEKTFLFSSNCRPIITIKALVKTQIYRNKNISSDFISTNNGIISLLELWNHSFFFIFDSIATFNKLCNKRYNENEYSNEFLNWLFFWMSMNEEKMITKSEYEKDFFVLNMLQNSKGVCKFKHKKHPGTWLELIYWVVIIRWLVDNVITILELQVWVFIIFNHF